ncbi:uncharacterized protein LOC133823755 [Humulus lupulus]|uniref:uncharacterized protein LOC133823755 n=1 Tax=Humulus lupulus TaxID=3486 RepID=UPI002B408D0B|nr:uncharacterized protein LOC133823755 [Humulus lupulus]
MVYNVREKVRENGMTLVVIYAQYDGEWKDDQGLYNGHQRIRKLYLSLLMTPILPYLLDCGENNRRVALHVELIKREDICDREVERGIKENEQSLVDDYFDCEFYIENNICDAASAPGESCKRKHHQASAAVVANVVRSSFDGQKETLKPKAIMMIMQNNHMPITYWKAWKGENLQTTFLEVDEDSKFKYVFLAYGACIKGFRCMRKVIAVDGTWWKTKYKGVMLIATTQDGNFHQYPIAWAIVDSEWHLSQNIKARVRVKGVTKVFEQTANAYKFYDFNKLYDELKNKYSVAVKYLEESNLTLSKWARSHFTGCWYNIITTNGAKSINAALREPREYLIIALLEAMQAKFSEWFNNRRNIVASINTKCTPLTPKAENIIRKRFKKASEMNVKQLNRFEYEVTGKENDAIIDLGQRQCSCRVFDLDQLPCVHALASYEQAGIEVYDLCSNYYKLETWALLIPFI